MLQPGLIHELLVAVIHRTCNQKINYSMLEIMIKKQFTFKGWLYVVEDVYRQQMISHLELP